MPYIHHYKRDEMDGNIESLNISIKSAGDLNYAITKLLHGFIETNGERYESYNSAIGVLDCASKEFYRRKIVPYEELKIKENGDIE